MSFPVDGQENVILGPQLQVYTPPATETNLPLGRSTGATQQLLLSVSDKQHPQLSHHD